MNLNLSQLSKETGLTEKQLKTIYLEYLKLIKQKAEETFKGLITDDDKERNDIYYNRGEYCFYLRYLGKYYINYPAYKKARKKILERNEYQENKKDNPDIYSGNNNS